MLDRSHLYAYQNRIVEFVKAHEQCALWVDMGLGKTVSTLTAFLDLLDNFHCRRMLVVAPLRVARKVWADEIAEWSHLKGLTIASITGTPEERTQALRTPADIHTVNREQMMWLEAQFIQGRKKLRNWPWDLTTFDESQSFKSGDAERFKSVKRLRKFMERIVTLTGTPAPNGLHDLWAQYNILDKGQRLGATQGAFRDRWFDCHQVDGYAKWMPREGADKHIQRAVQDITLSLKAEDYLELPPVKNNFIRVTLPPKALDKYHRLEKELILELGADVSITAANSGALSQKLLQMANGAVYDENHKYHEVHEEKLNALVETLDATSGKALIVYAFQHDKERMGQALDKYCKKERKTWAILRSDESFIRWARGEYNYGILHPASAGHGLNDVYKSGAETLIHFGLTNNLEFYQQVNARLTGGHRRTGKNIVIHHIVCEDTYDVEVVKLLDRKDNVQYSMSRALANYVKETLCATPRSRLLWTPSQPDLDWLQ